MAGVQALAAAISGRDGAVRLAVRVQPGARQAGLRGLHGEAVRVAVAAPAQDGRANEAVVTLVAELCGVPRRAVTIVAGHGSRSKVVEIAAPRQAVIDALQRAVPSVVA